MTNMSYCRFRNTLPDLEDCADNLWDLEDDDTAELKARKRLIKLCGEIYEEGKELLEEN